MQAAGVGRAVASAVADEYARHGIHKSQKEKAQSKSEKALLYALGSGPRLRYACNQG